MPESSTSNPIDKKSLKMSSNISTTESTRHQLMHDWLQSVIPNQPFRVDSLPGDASFRRYHRIYIEHPQSETDDSSSEQVYILMDAPPTQESITEFVQVAELMANTLNVPDIVAKHMDEGFLLLQDFGTVEFAHLLVDATEDEIDAHYKKAMQSLLDLQGIELAMAQKADLPYYDAEMLIQEMKLFSEWFLPYVGIKQDAENALIWQSLQHEIVKDVLTQPEVIVHRDYHSRNLMQDRADSRRLGVIDFQDAVIGAYSYDLVSLLRDAYVRWDEAIITRWLEEYWEMLPEAIQQCRSFNQFYQDVTVMGVQRHLKVLGIFVRLSERDGKTRYLSDIPKVMDDLIYELQWMSNHGSGNLQPLASAFLEWLELIVMPAYASKFL